MVHAGGERLTGLHYGTYDYSAFTGIAAALPVARAPRRRPRQAIMQAAAAGTGVRLSDGSTNILPVGDADAVRGRVAQPPPAGPPLAGARLLPGLGPAPGAAADPVRRDVRVLPRGTRPPRCDRLEAYVAHVERRDLDEPATARALARYVLRGIDCGAVDAAEVPGLDLASLWSSRVAGWARAGGEPVRQGGEPRRPDRPRHARGTRSATSTSRPRCAASSPTPT